MHIIVQPGETITTLAKRYHTSIEAILAANNPTEPGYVYPGQLLNIPGLIESSVQGKEYLVQPGESLYDIATAHDVSLRELILVNNITAPYLVYTGQGLILPEKSES